MNTNWNDPNFQGFGGRQSPFGKRPPRPKKEHKAIGTPLSRTLINLAVTLIFAAVYFYVLRTAYVAGLYEFHCGYVLA